MNKNEMSSTKQPDEKIVESENPKTIEETIETGSKTNHATLEIQESPIYFFSEDYSNSNMDAIVRSLFTDK